MATAISVPFATVHLLETETMKRKGQYEEGNRDSYPLGNKVYITTRVFNNTLQTTLV